MKAAETAARFERDGFIVIDNFFEPALMDALDRLVFEHFGNDPAFEHDDEFLEAAQTDVVPWFPQNDDVSAFDEIDNDPRLQDLTNRILGADWLSQYCMAMFSKRGSKGQAWHQDCAPENPTVFNLNRLVYTRDITVEGGGETVVVPGSHKRGLLPAGDPRGTFDGQQVILPRRGTLVMLHGHLWHRVLPIMDTCRFSINYRAAPFGTAADITDVCVYRNMRYQFSTSRIVEERLSPF